MLLSFCEGQQSLVRSTSDGGHLPTPSNTLQPGMGLWKIGEADFMYSIIIKRACTERVMLLAISSSARGEPVTKASASKSDVEC